MHLLRRESNMAICSQEMRAQNAVLRARSDVVNEDLERLRQLNQKQQAMVSISVIDVGVTTLL